MNKILTSIIGKISIVPGIILIIFSGCKQTNDNLAEFKGIMAERDSLLNVAETKEKQLEEMNFYFSSISECLDSITEQEHILLVSVDPETNHRFSKTEMKHRLNLLADVINRQRQRIQQLTDSLSNTTDTVRFNSLSKMVVYLSQQLDAKEAKINSLIAEISSKNRNIAQLTESVNSLQSKVAEVTEKNEALSTAVKEQTRIINETYVLIGDKKRLQELGVLTKGNILKKSKFSPDNVNLSVCQKVDISKVRNIPLNSKKPKILSAVPNGCYKIIDNGANGKMLIIEDATAFWSLSNILVIQL